MVSRPLPAQVEGVFPRCEMGGYVQSTCRHGAVSVIPVGCGKCGPCMVRWRAKVRRRIVEGARGRADLRFVTLTLDPSAYPADVDPRPGPRRREQLLVHFLDRWRSLRRNVLWRRYAGAYFRVIELTKKGVPHLHLVTEQRIPLAAAATGTTRAHWKAQLSPEARELYQTLQAYGFGIYHSELVRHSRASGAYLAKYLGKSKTLRIGRRSCRVAEGSRNWGAPDRVRSFANRFGTIWRQRATPKDRSCSCEPPPRSPMREGAIRLRNREFWQQQLDGIPLWRARAAYWQARVKDYRKFRAKNRDRLPDALLEFERHRADAGFRGLQRDGYHGTKDTLVHLLERERC